MLGPLGITQTLSLKTVAELASSGDNYAAGILVYLLLQLVKEEGRWDILLILHLMKFVVETAPALQMNYLNGIGNALRSLLYSNLHSPSAHTFTAAQILMSNVLCYVKPEALCDDDDTWLAVTVKCAQKDPIWQVMKKHHLLENMFVLLLLCYFMLRSRNAAEDPPTWISSLFDKACINGILKNISASTVTREILELFRHLLHSKLLKSKDQVLLQKCRKQAFEEEGCGDELKIDGVDEVGAVCEYLIQLVISSSSSADMNPRSQRRRLLEEIEFFSLDRIAGSASQHNILETADNSGEMELIRLDNEMCNDANSKTSIEKFQENILGEDLTKKQSSHWSVEWDNSGGCAVERIKPRAFAVLTGAWEYTLVATDVIEDANDELRARAK
ncbi:Protein PUTATIVE RECOMBINATION INITIATION DEFECT 1 [Linum grandiflorum]